MIGIEVKNLIVSFGGLKAVNNISFESREGEILSIVGPNGSGKTTLFNAITGHVKPTSGTVMFNGKKLEKLPIHKISKIGIVRTFQKCSFFPSLSVLENVLMGQHMKLEPSMIGYIVPTINRKKEKDAKKRAIELLNFVGLYDLKDSTAKTLSYGKQRLLGVAIALATNPKLLLLDEPCAGSDPSECENIVNIIKKMQDTGISIILVEHHMRVVMQLSGRVIVLNSGIKMAEGTPEEIQNNPEVIEAYLGKRGGIRSA